MRSTKSETKIKDHLLLPRLNDKILQSKLLPASSLLLSSIEKTKHKKNLMKQLKSNRNHSESSSDSIIILKRLESRKGKQKQAELIIISKNEDKRTYLQQQYVKESLVGEEAIQKFYLRYKLSEKYKEKQEFLMKKNILTDIVSLLQDQNFSPRKLDIIKVKGEEAILDLKKLGLGHGSMGPVINELMNYFQKFEQIDLSYNRIDVLLSESLIEKMGKVKSVYFSHNRIGKVGCQKFGELFLMSTTRIQELDLQENQLLDNGGVYLVQHLSMYNNLKKLRLSKNSLSGKFAQKMKEYLSKDRTLTELYLNWNEFNSKSVQLIFQGLQNNNHLKVFDFSWNPIDFENCQMLASILQLHEALIHADFSFCEINLEGIEVLSKALLTNHTLYGVHFEGNSGYVNSCGFLVKTEKEHSEYPLPIIKGIIRKISGLTPNPTNEFKSVGSRDVCWICNSWQENHFVFRPEDVDAKQCFIHFRHEEFQPVCLAFNSKSQQYEIDRMVPIGQVEFVFSFLVTRTERRFEVSSLYQIVDEQVNILFRDEGGMKSFGIKQRNVVVNEFVMDPVSSSYNPNVHLQPRTSQPKVQIVWNQVQLIAIQPKAKAKKTIIREEKPTVNLKNLQGEADNSFLNDENDRDNDINIIRKCIEFDVANSKIPKLIKDPSTLQLFKSLLENYYVNFKDCFYYLAKNNPSPSNIFSPTELDFERFLEEQRYVSKRVTHAKIMLKLYACISSVEDEEGQVKIKKTSQTQFKLISRPQFLQFLIRLALQKWCSFIPKQKKVNQKQRQKEKEKEKGGQDEDGKEQEQCKKLKLPLPLMDGLERTLKTLMRYADEYRASKWRKAKFLKIDNLIVIKAYEEFLYSLFEKYTTGRFKLSKPKKMSNLMILEEFRSIFIDTDIKRTKEAMKDVEICFLESKRLEVEDGVFQFGLNFDEFVECLGRCSETVWFNPVAYPQEDLWNVGMNRRNTPLFIKFEALIVNLYLRCSDLHSKRITKISDKGIFQLEMTVIIDKIRTMQRSYSSDLIWKMNRMEEREDISLEDVIEELRLKYSLMVIRKEEMVWQEEEGEIVVG